ncbi:hypothetical protein [Rhizomicrobium electricum]|uniref:Restriction endonuclease n=1 Tax=Rhizomicrobium electricum TaxID=480070 RepID=A0ABN1FDK7_9PROT|nr:hypothetical protein [Rhizomicrobium electricum]NIJ50841.1 hypothetical protein [Rhizomicrobium electricum]
MGLFIEPPTDADRGYLNLWEAKSNGEMAIRAALEELWVKYEPYADAGFPSKFARHPDEHFWEMYLTVLLLDEGKKIRPRKDVLKAEREVGPDICVLEQGRKVWIECVTPGAGKEGHPDSVPELGGKRTLHAAPRRQVELRITSSLKQKRDQIRAAREKGIISAEDVSVVAFSGANFWAQSATGGIPHALSAVYPIGEEYMIVNGDTFEVIESKYALSTKIPRKGGPDIARTAFLSGEYPELGGLIWSRRTIGNFVGQGCDFVYAHNATAQTKLDAKWARWSREFLIHTTKDEYVLEELTQEK